MNGEGRKVFLSGQWVPHWSFCGCPCVPVSPCHHLTLLSIFSVPGPGAALAHVMAPAPLASPASSDATADALQCSDARQPPCTGGGSYIYSRPGGKSFSWSLEAVLSCPVMRPLACILGDYHQWPWPRPRLTPVSPCDWHQLGCQGRVSARQSRLSSFIHDKNEPRQMLVQADTSTGPHAGSRVPRGSWHLQSI